MKRTLFFLSALAFVMGTDRAAGHAQTAAMASSSGTSAGAVVSTGPAVQVVLPVVVRDKKGALITNVQKSDLNLTQDGRPPTIQSLTRVADQPLRVGLLVDTSRNVLGAIDAEKKAAGGFVDQILPAEGAGTKDQAFLIHFDREVELLEDFTASKEKLHQSLGDMGPTAENRDDRQGPETTGDEESGERRGRHGGNQLYDAIYLASDEVMKNKDGRKALVIFSNGADRGSKETMNDAVDAADKAGLAVYTIFFKGEQEKSSYVDYPGGHHGGGYPGGGSGWPGSGGGHRKQPEPTSGAGVDGKKIMQEIAARTGGHAYEAKHTGDLEPIYKLIAEELGAQYLLTYTPDKPDDEGGYHKILLTTNNKDWTAATREGYYAPEGKQ